VSCAKLASFAVIFAILVGPLGSCIFCHQRSSSLRIEQRESANSMPKKGLQVTQRYVQTYCFHFESNGISLAMLFIILMCHYLSSFLAVNDT